MADKKDPMDGFRILNKDGSRRRDTGMIKDLGISEERRDELGKRDWSKPKEGASDTPNSWTTKECEQKKYSGWRVNALNGMTELWVVGMLKAMRRTADVNRNPGLLGDMHEEAFKTVGTLVEIELPMRRGKPGITAPQLGLRKGRRR